MGFRVKPPPSCPGIRQGHPLANDFLALWPIWTGSGSALTNLIWGLPQMSISGALWVPTAVGPGLYFDGTDDYTEAADDPLWTPTAGWTALGLVVHDASGAGNEGVVSHSVGVGMNERSWALNVSSTDKVQAAVSGDGTYDANYVATGATSLVLGSPHFVAATWTPSDKVRVYLDGKYDGISTSAPASLHNSTQKVRIALQYYNPGDVDDDLGTWNGSIAYVGVLGRALAAGEIARHAVKPGDLITPRRFF